MLFSWHWATVPGRGLAPIIFTAWSNYQRGKGRQAAERRAGLRPRVPASSILRRGLLEDPTASAASRISFISLKIIRFYRR
jgi:hypothetical protein